MKGLKGFTLIELLVVIGILGILSAALLVTINPVAQLQKGNDARRKSDLESIQRALELYYQDNGSYPPSATGGYTIMDNNVSVNWGGPWQPYIAILPKDPSSTYKYVYYATSTGQAYYLYASLQRKGNDPDACNKGNACPEILNPGANGGFPSATACGGTCNYGVSSTNVSP